MKQALTDRFPGATFLGEAEFAAAIPGRGFRHREVESEAIIERPTEAFLTNGGYQVHWTRAISYGTYTVERGIVLIDCPGCMRDYAGLGKERLYFRHQDRLFVANAAGKGSVFELLPVP